ncbi:MAG: lectin like domain-containing protein [Clostridiales bacterium]|nr:lectin like domain-containing protein [Clostridiales bacterium]
MPFGAYEYVVDLSNPYDKAYPSKLDQRGRKYIGPVKNGTSWALSALGALETFLGKVSDKMLDLSSLTTTLTSAPATSYSASGLKSGNFTLSMSYMSELGYMASDKDGMKAAKMAAVKNFEAVEYNISRLKGSITKFGSVVSSIYVGEFDKDAYSSKHSAYYEPSSELVPNHMIQIIGWDNSFPAERFAVTPEINGAWIAKDSRGESFGDKGYLYISYADHMVAKNLYVITEATEATEPLKLYSHGDSGANAAVNFNSKTAWSANTFEIDKDTEKLSAVSFYTANSNVSYEIWVSDQGKFSVRKLLKTGKADAAGYTTVDLDYPLTLRSNKVTILVKMTSDGVIHIPVEKGIATAESGQSYASSDGRTWIDVVENIIDANLCVRAWTTPIQAIQPIQPVQEESFKITT